MLEGNTSVAMKEIKLQQNNAPKKKGNTIIQKLFESIIRKVVQFVFTGVAMIFGGGNHSTSYFLSKMFGN